VPPVPRGATNITLAVLDNGIYEVTGGQRTAAAAVHAPSRVDYAGLARAAGFQGVHRFQQLEEWQREAGDVLAMPGPRFVVLEVEPVGADYVLESPGPMAQRLARFQQALAGA
jgi:phosphonopyruvate decarboxylase